MLRRRALVGACAQIGLAIVTLLVVVSPTASAANVEPRPKELWQTFPLNPTSERVDSTTQLPAKGRPRSDARLDATSARERSQQASRLSEVVLALGAAALLALVASIGVVSVRRLHARSHELRVSTPLWQGVSWPYSPGGSESRAGIATVGDRRTAESPPDVPALSYRWSDQSPARRSRVGGRRRRSSSSQSLAGTLIELVRRVRRGAWTEDTAPAIVGSAIAVLTAIVIIYTIG